MTSDKWTATTAALWQRICAHPFAAPARPQDFVAKLMQVQGWTRAQALEAIEEYRRFSFLACVEGRTMTPSDQVDEVWHLHLAHTRDYWEVWCRDVLGMVMHHDPSPGGAAELLRYRHHYAETLASYEKWFGTPPLRWWPGTHERFRRPQRFRRVDMETVWLLPRMRWLWRRASATILSTIGLASTAAALSVEDTPLDWHGADFLKLFAVLMLASSLLAMLWRRILRGNGASAGSGGLSPLEVAYLADGAARSLDTATADLLRQNVVAFDAGQRRFVVQTEAGNLSAPAAALRRLMQNDGRADQVLRLGTSLFGEAKQKLQRLGLLLDDAQSLRAALWPACLPGAVLVLGIAKAWIGSQRERPVAFLVALCAVMLVITLFFALRRPTRSRAGDQALKDLRRQHARAARAPRDNELPLAVALLGTAAMSGTVWADYHTLRAPPSSTSSSNDSSSSSSDSGSGDGSSGGGCGGCGGGGGD
jgi:uncharacterized protein (TIGR04222 family)